MLADGSVLFLAGIYSGSVKTDLAPGGNPWHDP